MLIRKKLVDLWPEICGDNERLGGLLRDIGFGCAKYTADELREVRNFLAHAKVEGERREGMLVAAIEMLDGFRDAQTTSARG